MTPLEALDASGLLPKIAATAWPDGERFSRIAEAADLLHVDNDQTPDGLYPFADVVVGCEIRHAGAWCLVVGKSERPDRLWLQPEGSNAAEWVDVAEGERFAMADPW